MSKIANKLKWYWNRLRCMSAAEMGFRAYKSFAMQTESHGLGTAAVPPVPTLENRSNYFLSCSKNVDVQCYVEAAEAILNGKIDVLSYKDIDIGIPPTWNQNVLNGIEAPLTFGKTLDYRDAGKVGDIKYIWVPNRHLHWVTLAQAYYLTGNTRYIDDIAMQLQTWLDQVPYLKGPNWTSSLELALRLINWSLVWQLIGGSESPLFDGEAGKSLKSRWLNSIYQHVHFIHGHYSRFSSANNHLVGEASGLFIATVMWPLWPEFETWQSSAKAELIKQIELQSTADGVSREQTTFYQHFVLDFFLLVGLAARTNGIKFPESYWQRIERMLEFIASVMDSGGNVPMIGDADDGVVVRLTTQSEFCPYKSLLATGAILFSRKEFKIKARTCDDKTRWLLGDEADKTFSNINSNGACLPVRREFPEGGYYLLGSDFETEQEIRAVVDAGPLGYLSISAHGHADALAMSLSVSGREFLIDPGTYAYQSKKKWRDYFRGTVAHNTVTVDGEDQSVIAGNFMWHYRANAWCEKWEPGEQSDRFVGVHDGYKRLKDQVVHRREIEFDKKEKRFLIVDYLECQGPHTIERHWHFSEACDVLKNEDSVMAANESVTIELRCSDIDTNVELCSGREEPPLGWASRQFDIKFPITTMVCTNKINGTTRLVTELNCK